MSFNAKPAIPHEDAPLGWTRFSVGLGEEDRNAGLGADSTFEGE
jgi:hypothetical protein